MWVPTHTSCRGRFCKSADSWGFVPRFAEVWFVQLGTGMISVALLTAVVALVVMVQTLRIRPAFKRSSRALLK